MQVFNLYGNTRGLTRMTTAKAICKEYVYKVVDSPVGKLKLVASDDGLAAILWERDNPHRVALNIVGEAPEHPVLVETLRQLTEYFAGESHDVRRDARPDRNRTPTQSVAGVAHDSLRRDAIIW